MDAAEPGEFFQGHSANRRQRPGEDFRVAVFTNHVRMDMVRIDAAMTAKQTSKSGGVQGGAGTEDSPRMSPTLGREAGGQVGHHVHGIGGHDEDSIWCMLE